MGLFHSHIFRVTKWNTKERERERERGEGKGKANSMNELGFGPSLPRSSSTHRFVPSHGAFEFRVDRDEVECSGVEFRVASVRR